MTVFDNAGQTRTEVQPVYGSASGTIIEGNDARLSDARTPLAHAATHASGGSDPVTPASIGALLNTNDQILSTQAGTPVLIVRGITGQAASVQEWRDGAGDLLAHITPQGSGFFREMGLATKLGGTVVSQFFQVDGLNRFAFSGFATALNVSRYDDSGNFRDTALQILRNGGTFLNTTLQVSDTTPTTGATNLTVKAGQGQGTTRLQEWEDNSGTVLSSVDESGNLEMNTRYVEFAETTAPAPGLSGEVRIFVDSSTGEVSAKKDNGTVVSLETPSAGGSFAAFQDAETPSGTINGSNDTFTLATAPSPASSLVLTKNGIVTGIRLGLHVELCHDYVSGRSRTAKRRQSAGLVPHRRFGRGRRSDGELPESGGFGNSRTRRFRQRTHRRAVPGLGKLIQPVDSQGMRAGQRFLAMAFRGYAFDRYAVDRVVDSRRSDERVAGGFANLDQFHRRGDRLQH